MKTYRNTLRVSLYAPKRGQEYGKRILRLVSMALAFALVFSLANVQNVEAKTKKKNIVVLYFSATGTTRDAAKKIGKATKGNVIEIKAKKPYTEEDLDYGDENSRVSKEHASAKTPAKSKVRQIGRASCRERV